MTLGETAPVPSRLWRVYRYALRRGAFLRKRDAIVAVLMADLPGLREDKAVRTADDVLRAITGGQTTWPS